MELFDIGTLVVDDRGSLAVLSQPGLQSGDMLGNGVVPTYYEGFTLPNISRWRGNVVRRVGTINQAIQLLASSGVDLTTPATKSDEELTDRELLQKVLADNAALKAQIAKQK